MRRGGDWIDVSPYTSYYTTTEPSTAARAQVEQPVQAMRRCTQNVYYNIIAAAAEKGEETAAATVAIYIYFFLHRPRLLH